MSEFQASMVKKGVQEQPKLHRKTWAHKVITPPHIYTYVCAYPPNTHKHTGEKKSKKVVLVTGVKHSGTCTQPDDLSSVLTGGMERIISRKPFSALHKGGCM